MYTVYVEYYYEDETHTFDNYDDAKKCYDSYCQCANTIVELNGPDIHISNNKEYLRG